MKKEKKIQIFEIWCSQFDPYIQKILIPSLGILLLCCRIELPKIDQVAHELIQKTWILEGLKKKKRHRSTGERSGARSRLFISVCGLTKPLKRKGFLLVQCLRSELYRVPFTPTTLVLFTQHPPNPLLNCFGFSFSIFFVCYCSNPNVRHMTSLSQPFCAYLNVWTMGYVP